MYVNKYESYRDLLTSSLTIVTNGAPFLLPTDPYPPLLPYTYKGRGENKENLKHEIHL